MLVGSVHTHHHGYDMQAHAPSSSPPAVAFATPDAVAVLFASSTALGENGTSWYAPRSRVAPGYLHAKGQIAGVRRRVDVRIATESKKTTDCRSKKKGRCAHRSKRNCNLRL